MCSATASVSSATATNSTADTSTAAVISAAARIYPADIPAVVAVGVPVVRIVIGRRIVRPCRVLAIPVPAPYPLRWVWTSRLGIPNHRRQRGCEGNDEKSNECWLLHGIFLQARSDY